MTPAPGVLSSSPDSHRHLHEHGTRIVKLFKDKRYVIRGLNAGSFSLLELGVCLLRTSDLHLRGVTVEADGPLGPDNQYWVLIKQIGGPVGEILLRSSTAEMEPVIRPHRV